MPFLVAIRDRSRPPDVREATAESVFTPHLKTHYEYPKHTPKHRMVVIFMARIVITC